MRKEVKGRQGTGDLKTKGIGRRLTAFLLAFTLVLCGLPVGSMGTGAVEEVQAASAGSTWDSWEDLYFSMNVTKGTYNYAKTGLKAIMTSTGLFDGETYWAKLVEVMESLDFGDGTEYEKAWACYRYVRDNVDYGGSSSGTGNTCYSALIDGLSKCAGMSVLFEMMCAYAGLDTMSIISIAEGNHEFSMVKVDGKWYFVDATNGIFLEGSHEWFMNSWSGGIPAGGYAYAVSLANEYCYNYYQTSCVGEHGNFTPAAGSASNRFETYKLYICDNCGYEIYLINTECTGGTGHTYTTETVAATESSYGYTKHTCSTCGKVYYDSFTAPLGHNWTEITVEPACTSRGYTCTYCTRCGRYKLYNADGTAEYDDTGTVDGYTENGAVSSIADTYGYTYTDADGAVYSTRYNYTAAAGHTWDSGTVTTAATATTAGTMTYTCTACGATKTEGIAAAGGSLSDAALALSYTECTYDGTAKKPAVTVTYDGTAVPQVSGSTTNYKVTYSSNTNPGTATVTVTAVSGSGWTGSKSATFTIAKDTAVITASIDSASIPAGSTARITASAAADTTGVSIPVSYKSSDTSVATVDSSGVVTGVSEGTATITVFTSSSSAYYEAAAAAIEVAVADPEKTDISGASVTLGTTTYTYDGTAKEPSVTVKLNGTTLTQGTDYTVSYSNNTDAGTAAVMVTACGHTYTGAASASFTIEPYDVSNGTLMTNGTCYYDGTAKEPSVFLYYSGYSNRLTQGTDYTVSYSNNVSAGTATATATGCGNYTGTISKDYTIYQLTIKEAVVTAADCTYTGTALEPEVTVELDGAVLAQGTDYTVSYSNNTSAGTGTATVTGCGNYFYTASAAFTIAEADIADASVTLGTASYTYDGTAKKPSVTASYNGLALSAASAYTVSYSNNTNAGTAAVTLTGKGNFTGTKVLEYTIEKAGQTVTVSAGSVTVEEGSTAAVTASTTGNGTITFLSTDVSIAEADGDGTITGVSEGTVAVIAIAAGTDNYAEGYATITVTVTAAETEPEEPEPVDISGAAVTLGTSTYTYDGTAKKPSVTVKLNGTTLTQGTDYTVSYSNNTNAGTATVTVTGTGDYTGTATKTFTIRKATQSISVSPGSVSLSAGGTKQLTVTGAKTTLSYKSSDTSVAAVSTSGRVTAKGTGTASVTVTAAATANYTAATRTVSVTVKPGTPSLSSVKNTTSGVKVTWKAVDGASGYYIYRATSSGGRYTKAGTVTSGSTTSWTNGTSGTNAVSSGKTYYYKVYAYSDGGTSGASSAKGIRYLTAGTVSSLTNTSTGITVKWAKVAGASGYYVYRKTSGGSYKKVKTITSASTVSWTDTSSALTSGTKYTYCVKPYCTSGSTTCTGSYTGKSVYRLGNVEVKTLTNTSKGITVKWSAVSGATGYKVYRKASGATGYTLVKKVTKPTTVSYTDKSSALANGTTYTYRVVAYKGTSTGSCTTKKTVRLTGVSLSSVTNSASGTATARWASKNARATGYQVQYSTSSTFASGSRTVTVAGASTLSAKVTGLSKNKTYYIRVRAYKTVSGTKYYSAWSTKKSVKVSK